MAVAFRDALVFDGHGFRDGWTVVVEGGRIAAAGPHARAPRGAEQIWGRGRTLLPGFCDAHVHIGFFDPAVVLAGGVTAARDLGWPLDAVRAIAQAQTGPRLLYAGPILTAPGGYPAGAAWAPAGTALEVSSPEDAREQVLRLAAAGACVVKIAQEPRAGESLDFETVRTICASAHAAGLGVASHCAGLDALEVALATGVDELAHGLWSEERIPDELVERLAERTVVVPTLHVHPVPSRIDNLARFAEAGGRVVYGTDMGNPPAPPGIDPEEIRLMVSAGIDLEAALSSATREAAAYLDVRDVGVVAAGARADLVLVEGDVRQDVLALGRPALVLRDGEAAT